TTDTGWDHDRDDPAVTRADTDYLLGEANRWLRRPLAWDDVVGRYAGLRPLVSGKGATTAALSRDHLVHEDPPGLVTVVGGKYTTYRLMARDAVDAATARRGERPPPSCTDHLPVVGADGVRALYHGTPRLAAESGLDERWIGHLLGRYGTRTTELLDLIADDPALGRAVPGAPGYL
ncbi:MAG: glycerol-3-phosphate dehydrogenase, partial [Pseudonocardiaceae bacterium]|nr:glycerol-3-phosphate dehydrogenase [Pseudonocardiaceae bacterium]